MTKQFPKHPRRLDLDLMRGLAIIAVIAIHCIAPVVTLREVGSASWLVGNFIDSAARWAVPIFVIISGGLLIKESTYLNIGAFYKKRLKRLALPLITWPIIYYLWILLMTRSASFSDFLHAYALGKPLGGYHLYFLFLIVGLYALAPIISAFVAIVPRRQVWITCIAILMVTTLSLHLNQFLNVPATYNAFNYFLPYVGYFLLGHLLIDMSKKYSHKLLVLGLTIIMIIVVICILSYLTMQHSGGLPFYEYTSLPVILLSIGVFFFVQEISYNLREIPSNILKVVESLSYNSFGIYLIHIILLEGTIRALGLKKENIITALLLIPTTLLLSWATVITLRRIKTTRPLVE